MLWFEFDLLVYFVIDIVQCGGFDEVVEIVCYVIVGGVILV